jgi:hypothetical protein
MRRNRALIVVKPAFNEGWLNDTILSLRRLRETFSKPGGSRCRGQSGGAGTVLWLTFED